MKKLLVAITALLVLLMLVCTAQAAGRTGGQVPRPIPKGVLTSRSGNSCSTDKDTYEAGEPIVFTVSYPAGGCYVLALAIDDHSYADPDYSDTLWQSGALTDRQATYDLVWTPGNYWIFVDYYNSTDIENSTPVEGSAVKITVTECSGTNSLYAMARQVVSNNRGASDYETFVNLYNWLLNNNAYDWDFHYFSAESVFFLHTGVCNSYARALELLLTTAGIPCRRVSGEAGNDGHAWNVVCIDGVWAQYDATWDDTDSGSASLYFYCGLPDELLSLDHTTAYIRGGSVNCSSLNNHYWIRRNTWSSFGSCLDDNWTEHDFHQDIADQVNGGNATIQLDYAEFFTDGLWYPVGGDSYRQCTFGFPKLYMKCLERFGLSLGEDTALDLTADFNLSDKTVSVSVLGWKNANTGELDLPEDLVTIEPRAFEGTDAANVLLPAGCLSIGERAFLNSGVQCVTFTNPDTTIGTDAFSGCNPLMFIAPDGSTAADYAEANGILRLRP